MTDAELAVLSLIIESPRHGYDVECAIAQRGMREWTDIGFSSIYYVLGKMEKAGLVQARTDESSGRGPARKVYSPTAEGLRVWQEASLKALSAPATRSPFALGLSNLPGLPPAAARNAVGEYRTQLAERLAGMRAKRAAQEPIQWFVRELFDFSETMLVAEIGWVDGLLGRLDERDRRE